MGAESVRRQFLLRFRVKGRKRNRPRVIVLVWLGDANTQQYSASELPAEHENEVVAIDTTTTGAVGNDQADATVSSTTTPEHFPGRVLHSHRFCLRVLTDNPAQFALDSSATEQYEVPVELLMQGGDFDLSSLSSYLSELFSLLDRVDPGVRLQLEQDSCTPQNGFWDHVKGIGRVGAVNAAISTGALDGSSGAEPTANMSTSSEWSCTHALSRLQALLVVCRQKRMQE